MGITQVLDLAYSRLEQPYWLLLMLVLVPLAWWMLRRTFIEIKEEPAVIAQKKRLRHIMYITRALIIIMLCTAMASPYLQVDKTIEGDPYVQFLVDESTSMKLFDDVSGYVADNLQKKMNTEIRQVGSEDVSNLGDAILANLKPHGSIILFSDGNNNAGADLGDVALYAKKLNASISLVRPEVINKDAGVTIIGPSKTMEGAENTFTILINKAGVFNPIPVVVKVDGEVVYDETTGQDMVTVTKKLNEGTHKIEASIAIDDYFPNNNAYMKTVRVVAQPKILFYSEKASPMLNLLKQLYVVDNAGSLPSNLQDYYAVVINDIPANELESETDRLNDYVADGNGLIVVGGENSYESGGYKGSMFETLLPVKIGTQEKSEGDVVIAIVIDISGSSGAPFGRFKSTADFSKAASVGIARGLRPETRLAVVAFNDKAYLISEPSMVYEKPHLENTIARLRWGGSTSISAGILKAIQVIGDFPGSKNIILLSDGQPQNEPAAIESVRYAANAGIKVYTVGVGPTTNEALMMDLAEVSNGIYFRATEESKLNIIFGPIDEQQGQAGAMELTVLNANHFITANYEPDNAQIHGFNQAVPKGAARLLVTTTTAEPILAVWRLGLGRVASLLTDDGGKWAGTLLGAKNSKLVTRIMNWGIGDPERKSDAFIDAKDTQLGEPTEITIKSPTVPAAEGITFYKIDEDLYSGSLTPLATGFMDVAGATFAVNYPIEYQSLGLNPEMDVVTQATGGRIFEKDDIAGMVEFAKTKATRAINSRYYYRWPFVLMAMLVFLLEIFIRRLIRKE
ncbi:VWA domain-containing protein [Candidatus Woesearchaeota archaeon]|nr:VWA domain-containing protein [Candidatus Woesearchaeota archaeon]